MYFALQSAFGLQRGSLNALGQLAEQYAQAFEDPDALGNFVENHDVPRFLAQCPNIQLYRSALMYAFFSRGIPIGYYGGEQLFNGADTDANRVPLWTTGFAQNGEQFTWLSLVLAYRRAAAVWQHPVVSQVLDDSVMAFSRGSTFVAVTNSAAGSEVRQVPGGSASPFPPGSRICNIFWPTQDCLNVGPQGQWTLYLNNGEQKIFDLEKNVHRFVSEQQMQGRRWPKELLPTNNHSAEHTSRTEPIALA